MDQNENSASHSFSSFLMVKKDEGGCGKYGIGAFVRLFARCENSRCKSGAQARMGLSLRIVRWWTAVFLQKSPFGSCRLASKEGITLPSS